MSLPKKILKWPGKSEQIIYLLQISSKVFQRLFKEFGVKTFQKKLFFTRYKIRYEIFLTFFRYTNVRASSQITPCCEPLIDEDSRPSLTTCRGLRNAHFWRRVGTSANVCQEEEDPGDHWCLGDHWYLEIIDILEITDVLEIFEDMWMATSKKWKATTISQPRWWAGSTPRCRRCRSRAPFWCPSALRTRNRKC